MTLNQPFALAQKASNSGGGDNGGHNDEMDFASNAIGIMLETALCRFPKEPHNYFAWALGNLDSISADDSFAEQSAQAHLYLLKQQSDKSNKRGGWDRENLVEFEDFLDKDYEPFQVAFEKFLKYLGFDNFNDFRNAVNIRRPVTRLPSKNPDVVTLDFTRKS